MFNVIFLVENNGNLSEKNKNAFFAARFPTFSQNEKVFA